MLLAQAKAFNNLAIPIRITAVQIIEQPTALIDHHDQSATRGVIFCVGTKVGSQVTNALTQKSDLHFR